MHLVMVLGILVSSRFHRSLVVVVGVGPKSIFALYEMGTHVILKPVEGKYVLDISLGHSSLVGCSMPVLIPLHISNSNGSL
jgi:hypothetical protein